MEETENTYNYPIDETNIIRLSHKESPAHVGSLANSVDFIVKENTPVKAAADGVVVEVKSDSNVGGFDRSFESEGNFIEIKHVYGEYSEYEHLRKGGALVKIGDSVTQGQVIGYSGATGWIANLGPHLHFMVGVYEGETYRTLKISWNVKKERFNSDI